ncbi:hypothetical protein EJ02DRAFT_509979 [Clathrospora elynae]|uniref:Ecp2 effector protein domain-containing protein n=1 Tax=Clathrospora elynae TaxID=706981 RepID=A0A6A5SX17_9PLEO|nr:hypothetical protein EJ02DRAFT_509979 [Clathrospora elynae]
MKSFAILSGLALAAMVAAVPAPDSEAPIVHSDFSFVEWVDTLIADPENALSPEEAIAAFTASSASLSKRQTFGNCQQLSQYPASIPDAVWCINNLAARGQAGQNCNVDGYGILQVKHGKAQIHTVKGGNSPLKSVNCNGIARAGGMVMDRCTRGDNTVTGIAYVPQGGVSVIIQGPNT